jgi:hypothetical protein
MDYPMSETSYSEARAAEEFLASRLRHMPNGLHYTSKFDTARGRRLILNRQIGFIGLFMEVNPESAGIPGVALQTKRSPGHYLPTTPRAGSVGRDERLGLGRHAYYVRCESLGALQQLVQWYERQ